MKVVDGFGDSWVAMPLVANEPDRQLATIGVAPLAMGRSELDIGQLYAEHAPFIGRVIQRLTGRHAQVDDLLQEVFIVAFKKRGEFRGDAAERTWLYAIAARLCMRHRRGARRLDAFRLRLRWHKRDMAFDPPDRELEREQCAALVHEVLAKLSFAQRETFVLYELEGLDGQTIAELAGVPLGTVWTRLHHAREKFQGLMRRRLAQETR